MQRAILIALVLWPISLRVAGVALRSEPPWDVAIDQVVARLAIREQALAECVFDVRQEIRIVREGDEGSASEQDLMEVHVLSFRQQEDRFSIDFRRDDAAGGWNIAGTVSPVTSNTFDGTYHWKAGEVPGRVKSVGIYDYVEFPLERMDFLTVLGVHELLGRMYMEEKGYPDAAIRLFPPSELINLASAARGGAEIELLPTADAGLVAPLPSGSSRVLKVSVLDLVFRDQVNVFWLDLDGDMAVARRLIRLESDDGTSIERTYDVVEWARCDALAYPARATGAVFRYANGKREQLNEFRFDVEARTFEPKDEIRRPEIGVGTLVVDRVNMVAYRVEENGVRPSPLYDEYSDTAFLATEDQLRDATQAISPHSGFVFRFLEPTNQLASMEANDPNLPNASTTTTHVSAYTWVALVSGGITLLLGLIYLVVRRGHLRHQPPS